MVKGTVSLSHSAIPSECPEFPELPELPVISFAFSCCAIVVVVVVEVGEDEESSGGLIWKSRKEVGREMNNWEGRSSNRWEADLSARIHVADITNSSVRREKDQEMMRNQNMIRNMRR
jgi:hypothetical protein